MNNIHIETVQARRPTKHFVGMSQPQSNVAFNEASAINKKLEIHQFYEHTQVSSCTLSPPHVLSPPYYLGAPCVWHVTIYSGKYWYQALGQRRVWPNSATNRWLYFINIASLKVGDSDWELRGRPLMIWGAEGKIKNEFIFSSRSPLQFFSS